MNVKDSEFKSLLEKYPQICVYGLSSDAQKPSNYVPAYMEENGWQIVGIYPKPHNTGDFKIYSKLSDVPVAERKFLDVFRSSDKIPELVDEVIATGGVEVLWLQLGISHPEAEAKAEKAGVKVVSNRCLIIEHKKYF